MLLSNNKKKKEISLEDDDLDFLNDSDTKDNDLDLDLDLSNDLDFGGSESLPPIEKHSELLKGLTNFTPYLKETLNNWLGISWNEEEKRYKRHPLLEPMLSIQGAVWCMSYLKTFVRDNNIITHINKEDYQDLLLDAVDTILLNLGTRVELGISNNGDLIRVSNEMLASIQLILMGAGDGKYSKLMNTVYHHNTNTNDNGINNMGISRMQPQNNRFLDKIRRFIK